MTKFLFKIVILIIAGYILWQIPAVQKYSNELKASIFEKVDNVTIEVDRVKGKVDETKKKVDVDDVADIDVIKYNSDKAQVDDDI